MQIGTVGASGCIHTHLQTIPQAQRPWEGLSVQGDYNALHGGEARSQLPAPMAVNASMRQCVAVRGNISRYVAIF